MRKSIFHKIPFYIIVGSKSNYFIRWTMQIILCGIMSLLCMCAYCLHIKNIKNEFESLDGYIISFIWNIQFDITNNQMNLHKRAK